VSTQQQVYGRLALERLGEEFKATRTGGPKPDPALQVVAPNLVAAAEDVTGRRSA